MFDILTEFGRVFWKDMTLEVAEAAARKHEPFFGAWRVVPTSGAVHGARA